MVPSTSGNVLSLALQCVRSLSRCIWGVLYDSLRDGYGLVKRYIPLCRPQFCQALNVSIHLLTVKTTDRLACETAFLLCCNETTQEARPEQSD